jgi:membrane associated rhomboid family serine protease
LDLGLIACRDRSAAVSERQLGRPAVTQSQEPIFNVPPVVIATIAFFCLTHAVRTWLFTNDVDLEFLLLFAFIPIRYDSTLLVAGMLPGGWAADIWSFVTYAFIHGDILHLGINSVWLLAFGSPLARRFGRVF